MEWRLVESNLKKSEGAVWVIEAKIQLQIEWSENKNEILENPKKNKRNKRNNLRTDGRRTEVRLYLEKPIPRLVINIVLNINKEE